MSIRRWMSQWRAKRAAKHTSGWDSPVTGNDLLASMIQAKDRRKRRNPLP